MSSRALIVGNENFARGMLDFDQFDVVNTESDLVLDDIIFRTKFDLIFLSMTLQTMTKEISMSEIGKYAEMLNDGGEICVLVPSMEWAIANVLSEDISSLIAYSMLYGDDEVQYKSAYLLPWLRGMVRAKGLGIRKATQVEIAQKVGDTSVFCLWNYVVGQKREDIEPINL